MHSLALNQNLIIIPRIIDHLVNVVYCLRWKTWDAVIISYLNFFSLAFLFLSVSIQCNVYSD